MKASDGYYLGPILKMFLGVGAFIALALDLHSGGASTKDSFDIAITGGGFWCVIVSLSEGFIQMRRQHRDTAEGLYLQALANQMTAYATLAEHARDKVMCDDFKARLERLSQDFEKVRTRCEVRLGWFEK